MIQCAIAGLGRWGRSLVEAAQRGGRLRITDAVEPDAERARDFCAAHELGLAESLEAMLAKPEIEAVLLATPHSQHLAQVIAAASVGK
jgi:predicted dehydrogenase